MPLRYLFGPVDADFAAHKLAGVRQAGECLAFGPSPGVDLTIGPTDSWDNVRSRLPAGWTPDFVALGLPYTVVPDALWQAPLPKVALAGDWNLLWHSHRPRFQRCDLILADAAGVEVCRQAGFPAAQACFYGPGRDFLEFAWPDGERDIDVLFVGNLHPAVQKERLPWLARLAQRADRWRVRIATGVQGDDYRRLLARAKIVFNRSVRGEANQRAFEAACAGALLFQERHNRELPTFFTDRRDCVSYGDDDLEALLDHYLQHDEERRSLASAARAKVAGYSFEQLWQRALAEHITPRWDELRAAVRTPAVLNLEERVAEDLGFAGPPAPALAARLDDALSNPSAALHHARGLLAARVALVRGLPTAEAARAAVDHFLQAATLDPTHVTTGVSLALSLAAVGRGGDAAAQARRTLAVLDGPNPLSAATLDPSPFPPVFDDVRVAWEEAAWQNAGRPTAEAEAKRELLRGRLHRLLGELTGGLSHFYEAVVARPDLPHNRVALGTALVRAKQAAAGLPHLRRAADALPFDRGLAATVNEVLQGADHESERQMRTLVRRRLARAAPGLVPVEAWFAAAPAPDAPTVVWEGAVADLASLALVNRAVCRRLAERGVELSILPPPSPAHLKLPTVPVPVAVEACLKRPLSRPADVCVRHQWPPNPQPPTQGVWVLFQPWEFGSTPRSWVELMAGPVDEVWVYTTWNRDCYVRDGVPADKVHVIPLGVDPDLFQPGLRPLPLASRKRFRFLFVGGTLWRKGIDLLLEAYAQAFTADDDVCLVVKEMGAESHYRGQTAQRRIAALRKTPGAPEVEYLDRPLSDAELAGLYAACDCLVHPYRGEGFGLPIAEAMACGLPPLVTGYGSALDFCTEETAYLLPATVVHAQEKRVDALETVDFPFRAEVPVEALVERLRYVAAHPEEVKAKGRTASAVIRGQWTWEQTAAAVEKRLEVLRHRTPCRTQQVVASVRPADDAVRVSLTMIVKNEEANLADCLTPVRDLFHEMIVVDTGSTDRTKEIALGLGAKVFDFPWVDSFSAARNEALRHATGDWAFWLDGDDRVDPANVAKLRQLFAGLRDENAAYVVKCRCVPDGPGSAATVVDHVRLFPLRPEIRWKYRVHEQILPAVRAAGGEARWTDVVVEHVGYTDPALRSRKLARDLRLLRLEQAEQPDDPFTLFNLASVLLESGQAAEALPSAVRSLERSNPRDSIVRKLYALKAQAHRQLGQTAEALAACVEGRRHYPEDAELGFREGMLRRETGDLPGAEACFQALLTRKEGAHFASVDSGLAGFKARHNLAVVYQEQGRLAEAEAEWRAAVAEEPSFTPAWLGLGDLRLRQRDWAGLEAVAADLERTSPGAGTALRARGLLARKEYGAARSLVEAALVQLPRSVGLRRVLTHVLLQEGRDWKAAEAALRAVLAVAPDDAEARSNLAVLLRDQARRAGAPTPA